MSLGDLLQSGDWKGEKHVPVISAPESVGAGEEFKINVNIGEEIAHPNTFEHYIAWIKVYFKPEGGKFPIEISNNSFSAHGESEVFTSPNVDVKFKTNTSGTIYAVSYCNIHGLWENSAEISVK